MNLNFRVIFNQKSMSEFTMQLTIKDDEKKAARALNADDAFILIHDIDNSLRDKIKHGHDFKTPEEAMEYVREMIVDSNLLEPLE